MRLITWIFSEFERLGIAKKGRHRNEEVPKERLCFIGVVAQEIEVIREVFAAGDLHAPRDAPQHGRALVFGKIVPGSNPHMGENTLQQFLVDTLLVGDRRSLPVMDEFDEPLCKFVHRKHEIGNSRRNGTARHRRKFGFVRVLNQDDAAGFLDRADPDRAVGTCTGEDDGKAVAMLFGERTEKEIDGRALAPGLVERDRRYFAIRDLQPAIGGNDVHMICAQGLRGSDLAHRHARACAKDARQFAAALRIQVDDDNESQTGALRQCTEKKLQCLDAAGRRADPDNEWLGPLCVGFLTRETIIFIVVCHRAAP